MDSYLEWLNRSKDETKSLDYYKGFIEGSRYNLDDLFEAFGETTLKPHLTELLKFHTEGLDKYEKFETKLRLLGGKIERRDDDIISPEKLTEGIRNESYL
jgi:hypothetical protein